MIHIDDFTGEDSTTDWYKAFINNVIYPVTTGSNSLSYSRAKWWPEHDPKPIIDQPVTPIMIVEGVGSSRKELRDYMSIKIFVDTPRSICIERGLARDRGMGGKSEEEIVALWEQWLKWDDEYFAKDNPQSIADTIVDGTKPYDDILKALQYKSQEYIR